MCCEVTIAFTYLSMSLIQPHNNRFMICCDTCLEWFHGKCVGVTKGMGKEMEEAGNEWRCPKCKKGDEERMKEGLVQKLKEREEDKKRREEEQKKQPKKKTLPLKRNSSKNRPGEGLEKVVPEFLLMCMDRDIISFQCSLNLRNGHALCAQSPRGTSLSSAQMNASSGTRQRPKMLFKRTRRGR